MKRSVAKGLVLLAVLAGCATPEPVPVGAKPPGVDPELPPSEPSAPQSRSDGTQPLGTAPPASAACRRALPPPGPGTHKEVTAIENKARSWLNDGEEDKARAELECALQLEPDNKQVACLLRGITADLSAAQAGESTPYTVSRNDNLGNIAQRFLGDSCEFYMLARFNRMKSPKQLSLGQVIRLPGRINVAAPPPPQPPVTHQPVTKPVPVVPPKPEQPPPSPPATPAPPPPKTEPSRAEVDRLYRRCVDEYRRQNLAAAIAACDQALALDPNHNGARVTRQQAVELQRKLDGFKN